MERLIVGLSALLFVITWTFLFILVLQPEEKVYMAKQHSISKEMLISEKESERFFAIAKLEENKSSVEFKDSIKKQDINDLIEFNNGDGVSIDVLLELFDLSEEAAPQS
ncbi:hypothetical protein E3U55_01275 [Filobacillus milosensis]|uniref:Uncharacterized protein n=1 Tax=Filobacillus milosensis TaxID=94137 RepID=A0A4Y8IVE3_9BACI|nr:hypothetical protein [Filobacillus milosensis]TFB25053.1 hypothetical protein E3U55_01275 [Filobacillus milosensis]